MYTSDTVEHSTGMCSASINPNCVDPSATDPAAAPLESQSIDSDAAPVHDIFLFVAVQ